MKYFNPIQKMCKLCKCVIINGQNGCAMYDTCTDCKPVHYITQPRQKASYTYDDIDKLENMCINDYDD